MATRVKIESAEDPRDDTGIDKTHNLPPDDVVINTNELRQKISKIEALLADIADIRGDVKDGFTELKGLGYDVKAIRTLIRLRAMDQETRREAEAILDLYKHALGMDD